MRQAGLLLTIGGGVVALAACATDTTEAGGGADGGAIVSTIGPPVLHADLRDAQGRSRAHATVEQSGDSLRVRIEATGMSSGSYDACSHHRPLRPPAFTTAGPHGIRPRRSTARTIPRECTGRSAQSDGRRRRRGSFEYTIPNAGLSGMLPNRVIDADGAAVVIHEKPDDFRTDPSGNSGARIACGVLG